MIRLAILLSASLLLTGCQGEKNMPDIKHFSIPDYIHEQINILKSSDCSTRKSVVIKGKRQEKTISNPDWNIELQVFYQKDLNMPAWKNSYTVDTSYRKDTTELQYKSIDKKAPVQSAEIIKKDDEIISLRLIYRKSTSWYTIRQTLTFLPGKGYTIDIVQNTPLEEEERYLVSGNFIKRL